MKIIVIAIVTLSLLLAFFATNKIEEPALLTLKFDNQGIFKEYQLWAQQNSKTVSNELHSYRFQIFRENYVQIMTHNLESNDGVTLKVNQFADLTLDEFKSTYMGRKKPTEKFKVEIQEFEPVNVDSVDWTKAGKVVAVKNQGQCGSCWAFSAVAGLEGAWAIKNSLVSLSEQQIVSCSKNGGNEGCNGGDLPPAFDYVVKNGIQTEASYPYTGTDSRCNFDASKVAFTPSGYKAVKPNSPASLEAAVVQQPVPICIEADSFAFQFYKSGVLDAASCGTDLDHCVLVSGFDNTAPKPYWAVKNSWGASWGNKGYIWIFKDMKEGSKGICGIYEEPVYPIL